MFYKFTHDDRNTNHKCMMFIIHDGHIYDICDKVLRASVKNMNNQVLSHNNIKNERKEKAKKREINEYKEYTEENYQQAQDSDEKIDLYTTDSSILTNHFYKSYFSGKWMKYKCVGHEMVSITYKKGCKIIFNEDWKNAEQLCYILDKEFNNQSITSLAIEKLDNDLSLLKSYFNKQTLDFTNKIHHSPIVRSFNSITNSLYSAFVVITKIVKSVINQSLIEDKLDDIGIGDFGSFL
jgi:hypothetical protein